MKATTAMALILPAVACYAVARRRERKKHPPGRVGVVYGVLLGGLLLGGALPRGAQAQTPDYLNPDLPLEQRVDDLVGRMTLEEKVSQMLDQAPAVERLGVPEYNWWNEALHGVARSGLATVFPQAIGLAATWSDSLLFRIILPHVRIVPERLTGSLPDGRVVSSVFPPMLRPTAHHEPNDEPEIST